jgi:two-component system chemotaxis response regulator CheB
MAGGRAYEGETVIVAIVCSAGGLEPMVQLLKGLPSSFPGVIVVSQHQAPGFPSRLTEILARRSVLPVTYRQ